MGETSILIVAATQKEVAPLLEVSHPNGELPIYLLISGMGVANTLLEMGRMKSYVERATLVLNAGIAGIVPPPHDTVGTIHWVISDCYHDYGLTRSGAFEPLPGTTFKTPLPETLKSFVIAESPACTVAHPSCGSYGHYSQQAALPGTLETMEGAAFSQACQLARGTSNGNKPWAQLRAISNLVSAPRHDRWNPDLAIKMLGATLCRILTTFGTNYRVQVL